MKKDRRNNVHDDRYTHADRAEIYENLVKNPKSTLASREQYARVPLKGMPQPTGKVYRGDEIKKPIEEIFRLNLINENDFKMEILEPVEHNVEFANHELKFCQLNNFINRDNLKIHCFPTMVYITENDKNTEYSFWLSKQNVYVLGDLKDRIIIAESENTVIITNRDETKHLCHGFTIDFDKDFKKFSIYIAAPETKLCSMSYRSGESSQFDATYEDICLKLKECFTKMYSVANINDFINLPEVEQKLFYALSVKHKEELATKKVKTKTLKNK